SPPRSSSPEVGIKDSSSNPSRSSTTSATTPVCPRYHSTATVTTATCAGCRQLLEMPQVRRRAARSDTDRYGGHRRRAGTGAAVSRRKGGPARFQIKRKRKMRHPQRGRPLLGARPDGGTSPAKAGQRREPPKQ